MPPRMESSPRPCWMPVLKTLSSSTSRQMCWLKGRGLGQWMSTPHPESTVRPQLTEPWPWTPPTPAFPALHI
uniref:Macaca fascicularis brain cDNA clone: QflA-21613, similar to human FLJ37183 protein (FLJ37183), mRNA, RefSeq: NM_198466.1 n=1 Tax=Macaca fascicularis TaxID=9541 RepID=I7GIP8_MACFA|nr:unnamed protein product [Macaca fascicularis]